jgi:hypothetical protein
MTILEKPDEGIAVRVFENQRGQWVVQLIDTDADQIFPTMKLFQTEALALAYAQSIVA